MHKSTATHSTSGGEREHTNEQEFNTNSSSRDMKAIPYGKEHLFFILCRTRRFVYLVPGHILFLDYIIVFCPAFYSNLLTHTFFSLSLFQSLQVTIMPLGAPVKEEAWATLNHDTEQAEMVMMLFKRRKIYSRPSTGLVVWEENTKKKNTTKRTLFHPPSGVRPDQRESCTIWQSRWRDGGQISLFNNDFDHGPGLVWIEILHFIPAWTRERSSPRAKGCAD